MTYIQAALKRDGDSLSPPLLGIHTLFLGPEFPLTWRNSGESHLFLLPAWLALSFVSPCGLVRVLWSWYMALPFHCSLHLMQFWSSVLAVALPEEEMQWSTLSKTFAPLANFSTDLKRQGTANCQNPTNEPANEFRRLLSVCLILAKGCLDYSNLNISQ